VYQKAGGPQPAQPSDLCLLSHFERVVYLNAEVAHGAFKSMY
jgi:hypothetical protein